MVQSNQVLDQKCFIACTWQYKILQHFWLAVLIYPMDGLQNFINIVEFPSLLHKQQLDLKNGYQQSLLSVDDFAGNMDVMTN